MQMAYEHTQETTTFRLGIRVETLAYIGLVALAFALRVISLGDMPLDARSATEALAALQSVRGVESVVAHNPLMGFANQVAFFIAAPSATNARISTALVGTLLVLGPLLWRESLGKTAALLMAVLLAISPVALTASRMMGAVTWTMAIVFVMVWATRRYAETGRKAYAITATCAAAAILVLTEPTGAITLLGVAVGLATALWRANPSIKIGPILKRWPWGEGLMAALGVIVVVGTGFMMAPSGLTSAGSTLYWLVQGMVERPDGTPFAYAFWVALRYDFGLVLFGLIAIFTLQRNFLADVLTGWFVWSLVVSILYANPTPDAALWVVIPAAGLTALLAAQMLRNPSTGYWVVPSWGMFLHATAMMVLLTSLAINATNISSILQGQTRPVYSHFVDTTVLTSSARIGTYDLNNPTSTFELYVPEPITLVIQIRELDRNVDPIVSIDSPDGFLAGPFTYTDGRRGLVQSITFPSAGNYFLKITGTGDQRGQYMVLPYASDVEERGLVGNFLPGYQLDIPEFRLLTRFVSTYAKSPLNLMVMVFLLMLMVIVYFLVGSLWGTRAAWRGLGLGLLGYCMVYGWGLGWQASHTFGDDPRELWNQAPMLEKSNRLVETLEQMSRFENGTRDRLSITVQGPDDGALAWLLREFPNATYVEGVGIETITAAVITPYGQDPIALGADYVGQDFILSTQWSLSELNWTDFGAWLFTRQTRFEPTPDLHYTLWVRSDVYGVQTVTTQ